MTDDLWQFEGADPSVGIFSDLVIHVCDDDDKHPEAAEVNTTYADLNQDTVRETTVYQCPVCKATTQVVGDYPKWYFGEPEDNED